MRGVRRSNWIRRLITTWAPAEWGMDGICKQLDLGCFYLVWVVGDLMGRFSKISFGWWAINVYSTIGLSTFLLRHHRKCIAHPHCGKLICNNISLLSEEILILSGHKQCSNPTKNEVQSAMITDNCPLILPSVSFFNLILRYTFRGPPGSTQWFNQHHVFLRSYAHIFLAYPRVSLCAVASKHLSGGRLSPRNPFRCSYLLPPEDPFFVVLLVCACLGSVI